MLQVNNNFYQFAEKVIMSETKKITEYDVLDSCPICGAEPEEPCAFEDPDFPDTLVVKYLTVHSERELNG